MTMTKTGEKYVLGGGPNAMWKTHLYAVMVWLFYKQITRLARFYAKEDIVPGWTALKAATFNLTHLGLFLPVTLLLDFGVTFYNYSPGYISYYSWSSISSNKWHGYLASIVSLAVRNIVLTMDFNKYL